MNLRRMVFLACAILLTFLPTLFAQAPNPQARLILSATPLDQATKEDDDLRLPVLRPNITQELFVYVQNDKAEAQTVIVQLLAGGVEVAAQKKEVGPGQFLPVAWPRPPAAANPTPLTALTGRVAFRLLDARGQALGTSIPLVVDRPSYYLDADLAFVPARGEEKNRLIATVTPTARFKGPPCNVQLVLDPERIPGLIPGRKVKGVYAGYVTGEKRGRNSFQPLYLVAEDIGIRADERDGVVTLQADGCNRAFTFRTTFAPSGTKPRPQQRGKESLRIDMPRLADSRKPVRVGIEADNLEQPMDARLVLEMLSIVDKGDKREVSEQFSPLAEFRGERSEQFFFAPAGRRGGLLFKPEVKDWSTALDLGGIHGKATLRLRLLGESGEPRGVLDAETGRQVTEVRKTIVLDDTPPEDVRFEKLPATAIRTKPLTLFARGTDEESGIRDVVFFLGKPPADAKLPPDALAAPGRRLEKGSDIWTAELLVPAEARVPFDVAVRFTNNIGLSTTEVARLGGVTDPPPPEPKVPRKASIAGTVTEGDRTQTGLTVELQSAAGQVLTTTRTAAAGAFLFKDLEPGDYQVSAAKTASDTKGTAQVKLAAGEEKKGVTIKLWR
jgi:hypothetical protein